MQQPGAQPSAPTPLPPPSNKKRPDLKEAIENLIPRIAKEREEEIKKAAAAAGGSAS